MFKPNDFILLCMHNSLYLSISIVFKTMGCIASMGCITSMKLIEQFSKSNCSVGYFCVVFFSFCEKVHRERIEKERFKENGK